MADETANPVAEEKQETRKSFLFDRKSFVALLRDISFKPKRKSVVKYSIHDADETVKLEMALGSREAVEGRVVDSLPRPQSHLSFDDGFALRFEGDVSSKQQAALVSSADLDIKTSVAPHRPINDEVPIESVAVDDIAHILYRDDAKQDDEPIFTDITPALIKEAGLRELQQGVRS